MVFEPVIKFFSKIVKICKYIYCFYDVSLPSICSQNYTYNL